MDAAPVGWSRVSEQNVVSMPSFLYVARARSPKVSLPSLQMNATLAPRRAAATAWFEPLPPGPILKSEPITVSPQAGARGVLKARSVMKLPMTVIHRSAIEKTPGRRLAYGHALHYRNAGLPPGPQEEQPQAVVRGAPGRVRGRRQAADARADRRDGCAPGAVCARDHRRQEALDVPDLP